VFSYVRGIPALSPEPLGGTAPLRAGHSKAGLWAGWHPRDGSRRWGWRPVRWPCPGPASRDP
jgi:hypothetical protein